MSTAKAETEPLLMGLPENCSLEDVQYHLYVLEKINAGLDRADEAGVLTHEEVTEHMSKWLSK